MLCGLATAQTTVGTTTNTVGNGHNKEVLANLDTGSNTLSTSYQTVEQIGHGLNFLMKCKAPLLLM